MRVGSSGSNPGITVDSVWIAASTVAAPSSASTAAAADPAMPWPFRLPALSAAGAETAGGNDNRPGREVLLGSPTS